MHPRPSVANPNATGWNQINVCLNVDGFESGGGVREPPCDDSREKRPTGWKMLAPQRRAGSLGHMARVLSHIVRGMVVTQNGASNTSTQPPRGHESGVGQVIAGRKRNDRRARPTQRELDPSLRRLPCEAVGQSAIRRRIRERPYHPSSDPSNGTRRHRSARGILRRTRH